MKEMIKRVREEKGGFTLAELLIVVAILLVLIAIAVPVFSGAMGNANNAVASANARSAKSEALTEYMLTTNPANSVTYYAGYNDKGDELYFSTSADDVDDAAEYRYEVTVAAGADGGNVTTTVQMKAPEDKTM